MSRTQSTRCVRRTLSRPVTSSRCTPTARSWLETISAPPNFNTCGKRSDGSQSSAVSSGSRQRSMQAGWTRHVLSPGASRLPRAALRGEHVLVWAAFRSRPHRGQFGRKTQISFGDANQPRAESAARCGPGGGYETGTRMLLNVSGF